MDMDLLKTFDTTFFFLNTGEPGHVERARTNKDYWFWIPQLRAFRFQKIWVSKKQNQ
jgi:hypothetical protein